MSKIAWASAAYAAALSVLLLSQPSLAAPRSWQGISSNMNWSIATNWTPIGGVIASDNILIGDQPNAAGDATIVDQPYTIDTLAISNGASVDTGGNLLDITNDVVINSGGSKLSVTPLTGGQTTDSLKADDITVLGGGILENSGARASLDGNISVRAGGQLRGFGDLRPVRLFNDGTITGTSPTEDLTVFSLNSTGFDLDGITESGVLDATSGSLRFDSAISDSFDSTMTVGEDQYIFFDEGVSVGAGGVINLQGGTNDTAWLRSLQSASINMAGTLNITQLTTAQNLALKSGATVNLPNSQDELALINYSSSIESGVSIVGDGTIRVYQFGSLLLEDQAQVDVTVQVGGTAGVGGASGTLHVGDGVASATVDKFVQGSAGILRMELEGTAPGEFDLMTFTDGADLDGQLNVNLINGFVPTAGNEFVILKSLGTPITGQFDTSPSQLPLLTGDLFWEIDYTNSLNVTLRVDTPYSADFDGDGDVDMDDLTHPIDGWNARYGVDLDGEDFLAWQQQFGSGVGPISLTQTVPEPTTWMFACMSAALCYSQRVRKNASYCIRESASRSR